VKHRFPVHGVFGAVVIAASEILLVRQNPWVMSYFTPLVWTGYILLADAAVAARKGTSPLTARRREFLLCIPLSIACWYVFEGVNLLLENWTYVNLPENTAARWIGYAWSYATIFPAIFITAELVDTFTGARLKNRRPLSISRGTETIFYVTGVALFVLTLIFPSRYLCPLPWVSVLLWFEGMNDRLAIGSFAEDFRKGDYTIFVSLLVSGAVCGVLWEFWNFWAQTKWQYHVPYLPDIKLFEMPVLGYLGFPPFAIECYLMYRFTRFITPARLGPDILGRDWRRTPAGGLT